MAPARDGLAAELETVELKDPGFPVVANATAEPVQDGATAKRLLVQQLVSPVRWVGCMQETAAIAGDGVTFVELGPGKVLSGLLKRIVDEPSVVSLGTADEVGAFLETHA